MQDGVHVCGRIGAMCGITCLAWYAVSSRPPRWQRGSCTPRTSVRADARARCMPVSRLPWSRTLTPLTAQVALMTTDWSYSDNYGNLGGVDIGYIEFGLSEFCFKTSVNTFQDSEHLVCFEYDVSRHLTSVPVAPSPPAPTVPATAHAASRKP